MWPSIYSLVYLQGHAICNCFTVSSTNINVDTCILLKNIIIAPLQDEKFVSHTFMWCIVFHLVCVLFAFIFNNNNCKSVMQQVKIRQ